MFDYKPGVCQVVVLLICRSQLNCLVTMVTGTRTEFSDSPFLPQLETGNVYHTSIQRKPSVTPLFLQVVSADLYNTNEISTDFIHRGGGSIKSVPGGDQLQRSRGGEPAGCGSLRSHDSQFNSVFQFVSVCFSEVR